MPALRAIERPHPRGVLEVHLPTRTYISDEHKPLEFMFLGQVETYLCDCDGLDCGFEECTIIYINQHICPGLYHRTLVLLFGTEVYNQIHFECLVPMGSKELRNWQELQITEAQFAHIKSMMITDVNTVYPFD